MAKKREPKITPEQRAAFDAWYAFETKSVKLDVRICFAIRYFDDEETAKAAGLASAAVNTYNGGMFDGMACGRDPGFDYTTPEGRKLFAVTC